MYTETYCLMKIFFLILLSWFDFFFFKHALRFLSNPMLLHADRALNSKSFQAGHLLAFLPQTSAGISLWCWDPEHNTASGGVALGTKGGCGCPLPASAD